MPGKGRKTFEETTGKLERIADGVKQHKSDSQFPTKHVNESELRKNCKDLEALRENYDRLENEARIAYDKYFEKLQETKEVISSSQLSLQGAYGKKNQVLADFGINPVKKKKKKKKEEAEKVKKETKKENETESENEEE
jgi:hypothetical protein